MSPQNYLQDYPAPAEVVIRGLRFGASRVSGEWDVNAVTDAEVEISRGPRFFGIAAGSKFTLDLTPMPHGNTRVEVVASRTIKDTEWGMLGNLMHDAQLHCMLQIVERLDARPETQVIPCTVLGGYQPPYADGTPTLLLAEASGVTIATGTEDTTIAIEDLVDLQVEDSDADVSTNRFMGGGHEAAVTMGMAALMNQLVSKGERNCLLTLQTTHAHFAFHVGTESPEDLEQVLLPLTSRIKVRQHKLNARARASWQGMPLVNALKELHELRITGVIDEQEFELAKARLLGGDVD